MSCKELRRAGVLARVKSGEPKLVNAAVMMGLSYRQTKRLAKRYREVGAKGLKHGSAGRESNRRKPRAECQSADPLRCPSRAPNAFGPHGTSRQSNTHSTEVQEIRYPWHPWYGRPVWIHGALVKGGLALYHCSLEQNHQAPLFSNTPVDVRIRCLLSNAPCGGARR